MKNQLTVHEFEDIKNTKFYYFSLIEVYHNFDNLKDKYSTFNEFNEFLRNDSTISNTLNRKGYIGINGLKLALLKSGLRDDYNEFDKSQGERLCEIQSSNLNKVLDESKKALEKSTSSFDVIFIPIGIFAIIAFLYWIFSHLMIKKNLIIRHHLIHHLIIHQNRVLTQVVVHQVQLIQDVRVKLDSLYLRQKVKKF